MSHVDWSMRWMDEHALSDLKRNGVEPRHGRPGRRALCGLLALSLMLHGCATLDAPVLRDPAETERPEAATLIVAPARFEPAARLDPLLRSKGKAAAQGAAEGALGGVGGTLYGVLLTGPLAILLLPVFVPLGAVVGAVSEPSVAATEETIQRGQQALERAMEQLQLQPRMQERLVAELQAEAVAKILIVDATIGPETPDERPPYRQPGGLLVLEIAVLELGFGRGETFSGKRGYTLDLTIRARLVDPDGRGVLDEIRQVRRSVAHTATEWLQDDAGRFAQAVNDAFGQSARDIVLEFFRLYYPPATTDSERSAKSSVPYYVLRPIYPEVRSGIDFRAAFSDKYAGGVSFLQFAAVDDLQPTLRWEAFPRQLDVSGAGGRRDRFSDVSYELALYQAVLDQSSPAHYVAGPLVYSRTGLPDPQHRLEEALQPCGRYAWTVRARFLFDGRPRLTEWTGAYDILGMQRLPWKYRRSVASAGDVVSQASDLYLLFRAPPAEGSTECAD